MVKVITYGSYDLLHYGHVRLLKRAKALGDYLIVGVTSDDYDKSRGKINLQQSLMERIEAVRATGLADEIIIEEYEGQKIDDIKRYDIDIFTVGSDWEGKFDYLNEYCKVVYLPRTEGVSSSEIREEKRTINLGLIGDGQFLNKVWRESRVVNGLHITALCSNKPSIMDEQAAKEIGIITNDIDIVLDSVDALYIRSFPQLHYEHIKAALKHGKHVLCESPLTLNKDQSKELIDIAANNGLILMEAIKTAYSTAYERLLLLIKSGKIGEIISVDSTCTSIRSGEEDGEWNCIYEWGPTAILPVLQILGCDFKEYSIATRIRNNGKDSFTKVNFFYSGSCGTIKVGDGFKSEGDLIVSGSMGYIYVPAPWWKTDYFEVRYENPAENRRYFYQLEGEGIRYELVSFVKAIETGFARGIINSDITLRMSEIMEKYENRENTIII